MITTIIPTYRRPKLLRRAIESVIYQTFSNIEIHVCDNNSGDETEVVVREFMAKDSRIRYFKNSENIGPINNIIRGIGRVESDYYSVLNDDDFITPKFYEAAIGEFLRYGDVRFVCGPVIHLDILRKEFFFRNQDWMPGYHLGGTDSARKMYGSHFTATGILFHRDVRDTLGSFEASGSDMLYMTLAAGLFPFCVMKFPVGAFISHIESYSVQGSVSAEDFSRIFLGMAETIRCVYELDVPEEKKAYLLFLVNDAYNRILETKQVRQLLKGESSGEWDLMSTRSGAKALFVLANKSPTWFAGLLTNLIRRGAKIRGERSNRIGWHSLPDDIYKIIKSNECDLMPVNSWIQEYESGK